MSESEALSLLGLAHRAGAVERGMDGARRAIREGRAHLVLIAGDVAATQLKKVTGLLEHRPVPRRRIADRAALGAALGAPPLSAVAITRREFAESMLRRLDDDGSAMARQDVASRESSGG